MVNPGICKRCSQCVKFEGVGRNPEGNLLSMPIMNCAVADSTLACDNVVPDRCPFRLEHLLVSEETKRLLAGWEEEFRET